MSGLPLLIHPLYYVIQHQCHSLCARIIQEDALLKSFAHTLWCQATGCPAHLESSSCTPVTSRGCFSMSWALSHSVYSMLWEHPSLGAVGSVWQDISAHFSTDVSADIRHCFRDTNSLAASLCTGEVLSNGPHQGPAGAEGWIFLPEALMLVVLHLAQSLTASQVDYCSPLILCTHSNFNKTAVNSKLFSCS